MASRKLTKRDLREDAFRDMLADGYRTILGSLERHWTLYTGIAVGIFLLVLLSYFLWNAHVKKTSNASYILAEITQTYDARITEEEQPATSVLPTFRDEKARDAKIESLLSDLEEAGGASANRKAGMLYRAAHLQRSGKTAEAAEAVSPLVKDDVFGPLALRFRALLYESDQKWDLAEADWKNLAARRSPTLPAGEGPWLLGSYYERRSENAKAIEAFEQAAAMLEERPEDDGLKTRVTGKLETLKGEA